MLQHRSGTGSSFVRKDTNGVMETVNMSPSTLVGPMYFSKTRLEGTAAGASGNPQCIEPGLFLFFFTSGAYTMPTVAAWKALYGELYAAGEPKDGLSWEVTVVNNDGLGNVTFVNSADIKKGPYTQFAGVPAFVSRRLIFRFMSDGTVEFNVV